MELRIQTTSDQSSTVFSETFQETYHSVHGAVTESRHVFLHAGFDKVASSKKAISIFEMGFGTGLNALLTLLETEKRNITVEYHSLELYPLETSISQNLQFPELNSPLLLEKLHHSVWETPTRITPQFTLQKTKADLLNYTFDRAYDLVYFDAFSPATQPHLWTQKIFDKIYRALNNEAILTTYCAKGEVRRSLQRAGFAVEQIPGPPGKREMLRATKDCKVQ
jgi:tRNA U34 5-methylaminomethyl-2-thiouridine-forming methyltransferase MnmC